MPSFAESVTFRKKIRKGLRGVHRRLREIGMVAKGLASTRHPLLVHIIPMRRCNLACTYCNEFDDFSKPVPLEEMFRRIDRLGAMGTSIITISGGEPLLHPDLDAIIARIRKNGMLAGLITNGYLLMAERIERLNRAGLEYLQISIDNVRPDEVSKKSLKVSGPEAPASGGARRVSREHQFRPRQRRPQSGRCAHRRAPGTRAGLHVHGRHHS